MTEIDLKKLLRRATWRMRMTRALIAALAALGGGLLLAALAVGAMRWSGRELVGTGVVAMLPFVVMACAGLAAMLLSRTPLATTAEHLDRCAATSEHLVTWLHLSALDDSNLSATQRGFRDAQRQSALRAAAAIRLDTALPILWPDWSRAIWIAMILLLSAILMPANEPSAWKTPDRSDGIGLVANSGGGGGGGKESSATLREPPRVQVLSPAEMRKLELISTDPELPAAVKSAALKEMLDAIGGVPESELTPEERQVLDSLRKDAGPKKELAAANSSGSATSNINETKHAPSQPITPAEYKAFEDVDKAWQASESKFDDVRERLNRYYGRKN